MTDRESRDRLIELILNCERVDLPLPIEYQQHLADYLLANGAFLLPEDLRDTEDFSISAFIEAMQMYNEKDRYIKMPCKVGDKTFLLLEKRSGGYDIIESECVCISENKYNKVYSMAIDCPEIGNTLEFHLSDFEKWVFLTKEEAEEKLRELR